ncbi:surface lipoprotein assembly modifier [Roseateles sp.]|uniref:surface lipoprotein assembly modifier n=1 Tax=Roseateles sp. TaxID=1971397 RepID=UPI003264D3CB
MSVSNAFAQDVLLDDAHARLDRHDAAGAYTLLAGAEVTRAGDARFDYLLGVAALDAGHITRAIFALERAVQQRPEDMLARAELGRAYLAAGDADAAREQWRLVRRADLPAGAAAAIDRVLGVVDQVAPAAGPRVSGYVELGVAHDSNVNSATHQGGFAIPAFGGILFQTTPENRQRHDLVLSSAGGMNAEAALSPSWKLVAAANLRATVDRVVHDMNTVFIDGTAGLRHTAGTQSQLIALQNNTAWVGGSRYRTANGLTAQWQAQLDATSQASVFGQWSRQAYKGQAERDTDRLLLGVGGARQFNGAGPLAYGSAYAVQERARASAFANFGHHGAGLRLGVEQRLAATVTGFGEWQYERRRYGGTEPFFDMARRDGQNDFSAGLRWSANARWQWVAQARRARVGSNVVLYDYARNVFQITAHRSFQ